ncbi:MAG: glycosyltransferase [Altererythrobacter sp.]|nr:glycosyltransferase [Altererythrobacter sp.]
MTSAIDILAWGVAGAASVPLLVLVLELIAGLRGSADVTPAARPGATATVLIPAHDEELGIGATIRALLAEAPAGTRVLVVADNCTDGTAARAREAGAEVVERHDPERRGKGYALAFGRDALAARGAPEVVLVLDADCRLLPGSIEALAVAALATGRPVQATNLITADLGAPPMVQISGFAMLVKNLYRSRGMQRLGGAALLTGTGMAFPWPLFAKASLATGSIVEDLALGIELTRAGHAPLLLEKAGVRSAPAAMADALQQRRRWEHGFLSVLRDQALPTLRQGIARGSRAEILLGLHLLVPPLALTIMACGVALLLVLVLAVAGATLVPAAILGALLAGAALLLTLAWLSAGREYLRAGALLRAPLYVLWKLPIYLGFLRRKEAGWTRTPRREDTVGGRISPD